MALQDTIGSIFVEVDSVNKTQSVPITFSYSIDSTGRLSLFVATGKVNKAFSGTVDVAAAECLAWVQAVNGNEAAQEKLLKERELAQLTEQKVTLDAKVAALEAELAAEVVVEVIP